MEHVCEEFPTILPSNMAETPNSNPNDLNAIIRQTALENAPFLTLSRRPSQKPTILSHRIAAAASTSLATSPYPSMHVSLSYCFIINSQLTEFFRRHARPAF